MRCHIAHLKSKFHIEVVLPRISAVTRPDFLHCFCAYDKAVDLKHVQKLSLRGISFVNTFVNKTLRLLSTLAPEICCQSLIGDAPPKRALRIKYVFRVDKYRNLAFCEFPDHTMLTCCACSRTASTAWLAGTRYRMCSKTPGSDVETLPRCTARR